MSEMNFTVEELRKMVADTLMSEFELTEAQIHPEARLREDLGLDSLDGVDMIVALEKSMKIRIPEGDARQMRTVADIYTFIDRVVSGELNAANAPQAAAQASTPAP